MALEYLHHSDTSPTIGEQFLEFRGMDRDALEATEQVPADIWATIEDLRRRVKRLEGRTWWSMFKDWLRSLWP